MGAAAALPRILNMTVPHVGHLPLMALRPFFMVSSTPSAIGFLALHLTQYPSDIKKFTAPHFMRKTVPQAIRKGSHRQFQSETIEKTMGIFIFRHY